MVVIRPLPPSLGGVANPSLARRVRAVPAGTEPSLRVDGGTPRSSTTRRALASASPTPNGGCIPRKVVDFSARSEIIREEAFHLHCWEASPREILRYLRDPRRELRKVGIELPEDCRIETTRENHDWLSAKTNALAANNGTIVCNIGGGNVAKTVYRFSITAAKSRMLASTGKTFSMAQLIRNA